MSSIAIVVTLAKISREILGQKSMDYLRVGHTVIRRFCTHYHGSTQIGSTKHITLEIPGFPWLNILCTTIHYLGYSTVKQPRFTMHSPWSVVLNLVKNLRETPRLEPSTLRLGVIHPNHYATKNLLIND